MSNNVYFRGNVYDGLDRLVPIYKGEDQTEQKQTSTVRQILERFARDQSQVPNVSTRGSYAAEFSDKEPLNSERLDTLLNTPDLSNMDEMEILDFINDNTELVDLQKQKKDVKTPDADTPPAPADE